MSSFNQVVLCTMIGSAIATVAIYTLDSPEPSPPIIYHIEITAPPDSLISLLQVNGAEFFCYPPNGAPAP